MSDPLELDGPAIQRWRSSVRDVLLQPHSADNGLTLARLLMLPPLELLQDSERAKRVAQAAADEAISMGAEADAQEYLAPLLFLLEPQFSGFSG